MTQTPTEEQKAIQRLSDDDEEDGDGHSKETASISFREFLVLSQIKDESKPEVYKYSQRSVNW